MRGVPFTPCKLSVVAGPRIEAGTFLVTAAGSAYRVERVSPSGRSIECTRWPADHHRVLRHLVAEWEWSPRHVTSVGPGRPGREWGPDD